MKITKILSALAAIIMLAAGACSDEVKYDPAPAYTGDEVYFKLDEIGTLMIEPQATSVSFHLYRVNKNGELTVGLESTVTNPSGESVADIFNVPTSVTFPDGQNAVEVPVGIVFSAVTAEMKYTLDVKIVGEEQTPYGATSGTFTLLYGTTYEPWAEYLEDQYATFQMAGLWDYYYEAPVYFHKSTNMPHLSQFRIEDPFGDVDFNYVMTVHSDIPVTLDGLEDEAYLVTLDNIVLDFMSDIFGDGSTGVFVDSYSWLNIYFTGIGRNYTPAQILELLARNEQTPSYYVPAKGTIYLNILLQKNEELGSSSSYYPSGGGINVIQLPGFKTYGVYIGEAGVSIDDTGLEEKQFEFAMTQDTPGLKYGIKAGELTDEQLGEAFEELAADKDAEVITKSGSIVKFELNPGPYTVYALGVDEEGNAIDDNGKPVVASRSFEYEPTFDDGYRTIGYMDFRDGYMCSIAEFDPMTWQVEVQTNENEPGVYRLKNPYRTWAELNEVPEMVIRGNHYLIIHAPKDNQVWIEKSNIGLRNTYAEGPLFVYSEAGRLLDAGRPLTNISVRRNLGEIKNEVVEFKVNTLLAAYESALPEWTTANTRSTFKLYLNTLTTEAPADMKIRSRIATREENTNLRTVRINMSQAAPLEARF